MTDYFDPRLTKSELKVAELVAQGKTSKQIANELGIGLGTVNKYLQISFEKIGIHSRGALAIWFEIKKESDRLKEQQKIDRTNW